MKHVAKHIRFDDVGVKIGWRVLYVSRVYVGDPLTLVLRKMLIHLTNSHSVSCC